MSLLTTKIQDNKLSRSELSYTLISCLFVGVLMLTNIIGTKLFVIFENNSFTWISKTGIVLTTGIITYPFTFLFTDIVSEIWGKARANAMVFFGFLLSIVMLFIISMAKAMPPAEIWQIGANNASFFHPDHYIYASNGAILGANSKAAQAAFNFSFDAPSTLIFASMLAYLVAQLLDNHLFHLYKKISKSKHLWLRNNASTCLSQLVDTCIVNAIFLHFYWALPWFKTTSQKPVSIFQVVLSTYICKMVIAVLDTPLIYLGVYLLRKLKIASPDPK